MPMLRFWISCVSSSVSIIILSCFTAVTGVAQTSAAEAGLTRVSVTDTGTNFILTNGYVTASISKSTGDMVSLKYHGLETMGYVSGHHAGYWEQNPAGAARKSATVTIDPATNAGERAEVSIKGWADGKALNSKNPGPDPGARGEDTASQARGRQVGPTAGLKRPPNAGTLVSRLAGGGGERGPVLDMEIRYTLGREDHGIYTYAVFTHPASYPATSLGESRYGFKLNGQVFDWLSIDESRNELMPTGEDWDRGTDLNMKEARRLTTGAHKGRAEHKYDYCADQFDTPAFGWSSTKEHIGLYFINPSMEFLSSGPQHYELTGHLDDGDGGDPTLLDYWRGTHYGGSSLPISVGEEWNKVVGPIFVYLDSAATPDAMFRDAKAQAVREAAKWPYGWVSGVDYPKAGERGTVNGQIVLKDRQAASMALPNLLVGLAYPDAGESESAGERGLGGQRMSWQNDAKHYEFWVHGTADGRFLIPKVRPGTYELHAIADGVLGEYVKASVTVSGGETVDLGRLEWTPVRYGRQLWQIGIPNRSAAEFLKGDDHWNWGMYLAYAKLFPHDVDYTVGRSDFRKDWYIYQVPHALNGDGTGRGQGRATTWTIHFAMPASYQSPIEGRAVLRMGISGIATKSIDVGVNGNAAGTVTGLIYNATINRDGVQGSWVEKDVTFDAAMLHPGENTMTLTVPAGGLTNGVAYDVLRLEVTGGK
jgi:rhamnogalacturonan endolyase